MIFNPSSLKRFSIALYTSELFFEQTIQYLPFLNVGLGGISYETVSINTPIYDFFNIEYSAFAKDMFYTTSSNPSQYYRGFIQSLTIDQIDLYKSVDTFNYSNFISQPQNDKIITKGTLSIPVVLPYLSSGEVSVNSINYNSLFLEQIWKLSVYMFVPFFINTDLYPQNIGGPLFVTDFEISIAENSPATISLNFLGGSNVPELSNLTSPPYPYQDNLTLLNVAGNYGFGQTAPVFRTAQNYDCLLSINVNDKISSTNSTIIYSSYNNYVSPIIVDGINISYMNLKIEYKTKQTFTANDGITKFLSDGIKYFSIDKRRVYGSIIFVASQNLNDYFISQKISSLMLYFGGPFYYPMNNVSIQVFKAELNADKSTFTHTVDFIAMLQPSQYKQYYLQNEFDINHINLYSSPTGKIYVTPQDPPLS
jgi:hypothetical protein